MKLPKILNPKAYIRKIQFIDGRRRYDKYFRSIWPSPEYIKMIRSEKFKYNPLISVIVPTYNTPKDFFIEMIESVICQVYQNWELVIIDDASTKSEVRDMIRSYAKKDSRIKYKFLKTNHHIAGATNEGFKMALGEFISLFDHDDILWPNALYEIVKSLNTNKEFDIIYTDEDKMSYDGVRHRDPFLKPDWNEGLLLSINYFTHFTTIRRKIIEKVNGEDGRYNGAQDWDLFLRATEVTQPERIHHISKILYSWRIHDASTAKSFSNKSYVVESQKKMLEAALERRKIKKSDYKLYENSGVWTYKIKDKKVLHGKMNFNNIKGLALTSKEIHRNIGRYSLIGYNYSHAQYDIDEVLFVPEEIYRKYW